MATPDGSSAAHITMSVHGGLVGQLPNSGKYSDLVIICGEARTYNVHKAVVCSQSEVLDSLSCRVTAFTTAIDDPTGQATRPIIDLSQDRPEDDFRTFDCLIKMMYTEPKPWYDDEPHSLQAAKFARLVDEFLATGFRKFSERVFREELDGGRDPRDRFTKLERLVAVVPYVYESTNLKQLRLDLTKHVCTHPDIESSAEVQELFATNLEFAKDVLEWRSKSMD